LIAHAGLPGLAAAREYLEGFEHVRGFGLADFLDTSLERILRSLALLPPTGPESRVLELGAQPYLMTALLKRLDPAITLLIIEHDMDVAFALADRITVLQYGRVVADGPSQTVKADPMVQEIYLGAMDA